MRTERPFACLECNTHFRVFPPEVTEAISDEGQVMASRDLGQPTEGDGMLYVLVDREGFLTCPGCGARFVGRGMFLDVS